MASCNVWCSSPWSEARGTSWNFIWLLFLSHSVNHIFFKVLLPDLFRHMISAFFNESPAALWLVLFARWCSNLSVFSDCGIKRTIKKTSWNATKYINLNIWKIYIFYLYYLVSCLLWRNLVFHIYRSVFCFLSFIITASGALIFSWTSKKWITLTLWDVIKVCLPLPKLHLQCICGRAPYTSLCIYVAWCVRYMHNGT